MKSVWKKRVKEESTENEKMQQNEKSGTWTETSTNSFKGGKYRLKPTSSYWMHFAPAMFMRIGREWVSECVWWFSCFKPFTQKNKNLCRMEKAAKREKRIMHNTNREKSMVALIKHVHFIWKQTEWNFRARVARFVLLIWCGFGVIRLLLFWSDWSSYGWVVVFFVTSYRITNRVC